MPLQLSVKLEAQHVRAAIRGFVVGVPRVGESALHKAMHKVIKRVTHYPPRFEGKYPFVSDKQRRYVMWAIRNGVIKVPYQRTGTYGRGWKIKKIENGWRVTGKAVQHGRDYTKWVSGSAYGTNQARIHQGRWALLRDVMDEETRNLPPVLAAQVRMVARRNNLQVSQ